MFGRGGEEILALQAAGVPFEVVPGITSAIAVPAYAGVPVTHRGLATSFTVVTGHSRHAVDRETNWEALAAAGGTIVVLMGVAHRAAIAARLLGRRPGRRHPGAGRALGHPTRAALDPHPPRRARRHAARAAGHPGDRRRSPGLELDWYERRPLFGRRVVVTRARPRPQPCPPACGTSAPGRSRCRPSRIEPPADGGAALDRAAPELAEGRYDWVVFSSANAVEALLARLRDARSFGPARIAAVGPGTADALADWRLVPDLVPDPSRGRRSAGSVSRPASARGCAGADPASRGRPGRAARRAWPAAGWEVDAVAAYRPCRCPLTAGRARAVAGADAVCFTSASAVRRLPGRAGGPGAVPARGGVHRSHHGGGGRGGGPRGGRRRRANTPSPGWSRRCWRCSRRAAREREHRVAGGDGGQLLVGRVRADALEEDADLGLPAPQVGPQDGTFSASVSSVATRSSRRRPTSRARWPSAARTLRTHSASPRGATR